MTFLMSFLSMLSLFKPSTGISLSQSFSNTSLAQTPLMHTMQTTAHLHDKNEVFQEKLNQIAADMDRRNNSFYGIGVAAREVIDTASSSWFSGILKWINGNTALHEAVLRQDLDYIKSISKCDLNKQNRWGKTPIQIAAEYDWCDGVKALIKAGAQLPSSFAHLHLSKEMLTTFVKTRIDTKTASILLMSVVKSNQREFVADFLNHDADMFQVIDGSCSFDVAFRENADSSLVEIFINHFIRTYATSKQNSGAVFFGPLPKDPFTTQFETIIRDVIEGKKGVSTVKKMNAVGQLFYNIIIDNVEYDMFKIVANMNWDHVRLNEQDLENFKRSPLYQSPNILMNSNYQHINPATLVLRPHDLNCPGGCDYINKYDDLSIFDKSMIFSYTDLSFIINPFLKGDLRDFNNQAYLKSVTLDPLFWWSYSAFLANALNKIPSETIHHFACRGQSSAERLHRINALTFISTSSLMSVCNDYVEKTGEILIFDDINGKDITPLSVLPFQREYVNLPSRIEVNAHALTSSVLLFSARLKKPDNTHMYKDQEQPNSLKI